MTVIVTCQGCGEMLEADVCKYGEQLHVEVEVCAQCGQKHGGGCRR